MEFRMRFKSDSNFYPNIRFSYTGNHRYTGDMFEVIIDCKSEDNKWMINEEGYLVGWIDRTFIRKYTEIDIK